MRGMSSTRAFFGLWLTATGLIVLSDAEAKSLEGSVTAVKSAEVIVLKHDAGTYDVRIFGTDAPERGQAFSEQARSFLTQRVLGKQVRILFKFRNPQGEMVSRLWV